MIIAPSLRPKWAGQFLDFDDWLNHARVLREWPGAERLGWGVAPPPAVCIDAKGRRCWSGWEFIRARDEGAFPISYFWEMEPIPADELSDEVLP